MTSIRATMSKDSAAGFNVSSVPWNTSRPSAAQTAADSADGSSPLALQPRTPAASIHAPQAAPHVQHFPRRPLHSLRHVQGEIHDAVLRFAKPLHADRTVFRPGLRHRSHGVVQPVRVPVNKPAPPAPDHFRNARVLHDQGIVPVAQHAVSFSRCPPCWFSLCLPAICRPLDPIIDYFRNMNHFTDCTDAGGFLPVQ